MEVALSTTVCAVDIETPAGSSTFFSFFCYLGSIGIYLHAGVSKSASHAE
jgi:hypothetical protein